MKEPPSPSLFQGFLFLLDVCGDDDQGNQEQDENGRGRVNPQQMGLPISSSFAFLPLLTGTASSRWSRDRSGGEPSSDGFRIEDSRGMASMKAGSRSDTGFSHVPAPLLVENRFPNVHPPFLGYSIHGQENGIGFDFLFWVKKRC